MWIMLLAFQVFASADKAHYPPQRLSARGITRVEIAGVRGKLHLIGRPGPAYRLTVSHSKIRFDDWNLLVERRGHTLVLEVSNSAYGKEWRRQIKRDRWPEFDIELEGPPVPSVIGWRDGDLAFERWNAGVEAAFLDGSLQIANGRGDYRVQAVNADVRVTRFRGDLKLRGERGDVGFSNIKGSLTLSWLHGNVVADDVDAKAQVEGVHLQTRVTSSRGDWDLRQTRGQAAFRDFGGKLRGRGAGTQWNVLGRSGADVQLVSGAGAVEVKVPSAAKVFLTSLTGPIASPITVEDRDGQRVAERLRSGLARGRVFVSTESGPIRFK